MPATDALPENMPELPPAPPRESMIATAVKFLQNTKVSQSPLEQKKQFLLKKGLTNKEIEIAISKAGVLTSGSSLLPVSPSISQQTVVQPVSAWTRFREYSTIAVIVGGVVYGLYSLYKRFIEPIFASAKKAQDEQLQKMEEGVKNIREDLTEIRSTMEEMQNLLGTQGVKISQVAANLTTYKVESGQGTVSNSAIGELKAEITSVKGLLLSRNQFPAQPVNKPVIPSWQMKPPAGEPKSDSESTRENATNATEDELRHKALENGHSTPDISGSEDESQTNPNVKQTHINGFGTDMQTTSGNAIITDEI